MTVVEVLKKHAPGPTIVGLGDKSWRATCPGCDWSATGTYEIDWTMSDWKKRNEPVMNAYYEHIAADLAGMTSDA